MGGQFLDESLDSKSYREHNWFKDPEPLPEPENKEELIEPAIEKIKDAPKIFLTEGSCKSNCLKYCANGPEYSKIPT